MRQYAGNKILGRYNSPQLTEILSLKFSDSPGYRSRNSQPNPNYFQSLQFPHSTALKANSRSPNTSSLRYQIQLISKIHPCVYPCLITRLSHFNLE